MVKKSSKKTLDKVSPKVATKTHAHGVGSKKTSAAKKRKKLKTFRRNLNSKNPHKSFRRTYREDYLRELETPGIMGHFVETFKILFQNYRLFLPLLGIFVLLAILLVGFMGQETYKSLETSLEQIQASGAAKLGAIEKAGILLISTITAGGLFGAAGEATGLLTVLIFLCIWLVTTFSLRHLLAGHKITVRDALYNSTSPLMATLAIFLVVAVQSIPVIIFIVALSAAIETQFLNTFVYAFLFFGFSALLIILSVYLWSSSLIALVAVTAPGLYPMEALKSASDLMFGRRLKFIIRLIALVFAVIFLWAIVMVPLILIDLGFKNFDWASGIPFIPFCLVVMTCFTAMFTSTYLYLYYRYLLGFDQTQKQAK